MKEAEFQRSLAEAEPPPGLDLALQGLWWAARGDWDRAHGCVQRREGTRRCDWVHAYLHRLEGDLANAGFWYRSAGQPVATVPPDEEHAELVTLLLAEPG